MELTVVDFKGKELDHVIKQASHKFLSHGSLVNSRVFFQFAWKLNIANFEKDVRSDK